MTTKIWISLTPRERAILTEALAVYIGGEAAKPNAAAALIRKVAQAKPYPDITVGVYGGVVQWIMGNPFPIRVCDYDGEEKDLPDLDGRGQRCTMGFEPPDKERRTQLSGRS
jgi:hypothetical protein